MYFGLILSAGKSAVGIFTSWDGTPQGTQPQSWLPGKRAGKNQQQNMLLLGDESDVTGHEIIIFTASNLPKSRGRNEPNSWFSGDKIELDPGCWQGWKELWDGTTDTYTSVFLLFSDDFLFSVPLIHHSYTPDSTGCIFLSLVFINLSYL